MKQNISVANKSYKNEFLLRGLLYCGNCGKVYLGTGSKGKNFYHCSDRNHIRSNTYTSCRNAMVNIKLDSVIWEVIKATVESAEHKKNIKSTIDKYSIELGNNNQLLQKKEDDLKAKDKEVNNLLNRVGLVPESVLNQTLQLIEERKKESLKLIDEILKLKQDISINNKQLSDIQTDRNNTNILKNIEPYFNLKKDATNEILKSIYTYKIDNSFIVLKVEFKTDYITYIVYNTKQKKYVELSGSIYTFNSTDNQFYFKGSEIKGFSLSVINTSMSVQDLYIDFVKDYISRKQNPDLNIIPANREI